MRDLQNVLVGYRVLLLYVMMVKDSDPSRKNLEHFDLYGKDLSYILIDELNKILHVFI